MPVLSWASSPSCLTDCLLQTPVAVVGATTQLWCRWAGSPGRCCLQGCLCWVWNWPIHTPGPSTPALGPDNAPRVLCWLGVPGGMMDLITYSLWAGSPPLSHCPRHLPVTPELSSHISCLHAILVCSGECGWGQIHFHPVSANTWPRLGHAGTRHFSVPRRVCVCLCAHTCAHFSLGLWRQWL